LEENKIKSEEVKLRKKIVEIEAAVDKLKAYCGGAQTTKFTEGDISALSSLAGGTGLKRDDATGYIKIGSGQNELCDMALDPLQSLINEIKNAKVEFKPTEIEKFIYKNHNPIYVRYLAHLLGKSITTEKVTKGKQHTRLVATKSLVRALAHYAMTHIDEKNGPYFNSGMRFYRDKEKDYFNSKSYKKFIDGIIKRAARKDVNIPDFIEKK